MTDTRRDTGRRNGPDDVVAYRPIGVVRSQHTDPGKTPIQPRFAEGCAGRLELLPQYEEGLRDIEGFSHIIVLYHLHRAGPALLSVTPFLEDRTHGVFATRHPRRPNPIGMSVLRLVQREGAVLYVDDVDILDGTPILDIKPFVARFDRGAETRDGWLGNVDEQEAQHRGRREPYHGGDR